jgi:putative ABC transport system permease protein
MNTGISQAPIGKRRQFLWLGLGMAALLGLLWMLPSLEHDGRSRIGGDIEIVTLNTPLSMAAEAYLTFHGAQVSHVIELQARARTLPSEGTAIIPVMVKGIEPSYPLYGTLKLEEKQRENTFFNNTRRQVYGAAIDPEALKTLGLQAGQLFRIGNATFRAQAVIDDEPDRPSLPLPRVLVSMTGLKRTKLLETRREIIYRYRLKLPDHTDAQSWRKELLAAFPDTEWTVTSWQDKQ